MDAMDPTDIFTEMNDELVSGVEQYLEAQQSFLDAWQRSIEQSTDDALVTSGVSGITDAYEIWMDASNQWMEQFAAAAEGEELDPREIRDIWLRAANDSSKALMNTEAFAKLTGESVSDSLELQRQRDEALQAMMEGMGMASSETVEEVGDRLVELERRQHAVEEKLDRLLEHLEDA